MAPLEIIYTPIAGSGALTVIFEDTPKIESLFPENSIGRYWLTPKGRLAGDEFDDVAEFEDIQKICTKSGEWVEVEI
ncbi:MAG: hypothetical protein HN353_13075 [Bdellovibrionales bacterium]|jgi:hypothetical protein|nr:hypothetical protein [Bdellovibrionales bacterium]MBT3524977.1 hypothetical protein [Bdellovibrionales bacterium]MBT7670361.1 hypothetical protein [Bdellovibrionales bacterium]MBT7766667.1 hypothetical protein [Bdellovibrionales bacterium]